MIKKQHLIKFSINAIMFFVVDFFFSMFLFDKENALLQNMAEAFYEALFFGFIMSLFLHYTRD